MSALDLARWQFASPPSTTSSSCRSLSAVAARRGHADAVVRTGDDRYLRLTKFWGKLFLINFAIGVVTGIVQEFQFGMNWTDVLPVRRRHLRRAAGDRGPAGVLPGVDVPRPVDLRLGPAAQAADPPRVASGSPRSARRCRPTSSSPRTRGCSTRSATVVNPHAAGPS